MKTSIILMLTGVRSKVIMGQGEVSRTLTGSWVEEFYRARHRRDDIDGAKGFIPLAAMMLYLQGAGQNGANPEDLADFDEQMKGLEDTYTNYGCYCWIDGLAGGVIGGGKTKDMVDHHCKELYRCYKCVVNDYNLNYTDTSYSVDFKRKNNERILDCTINSKQDAENICECDKRFAMNVAQAKADCDSGKAADEEWGAHCMKPEDFKTQNADGPFDPSSQCDKQFHGHEKENCCGIYPNRYPYDINFNDCCQTQMFDGDSKKIDVFSIQQQGVCGPAGGTVVVSSDDNPHLYVAV